MSVCLLFVCMCVFIFACVFIYFVCVCMFICVCVNIFCVSDASNILHFKCEMLHHVSTRGLWVKCPGCNKRSHMISSSILDNLMMIVLR